MGSVRKVTVSLDFNTVEEATLFLGKQIDPVIAKAVEVAANKPPIERPRGRPRKNTAAPQNEVHEKQHGATASAAAATPKAKPEGASAPADKVPGITPATPATGTVAPQAAPSGEASAPNPSAMVDVPKVPTEADVTNALQSVLDSVGMNKVTAIFARFGVKRGRELLPQDRERFITYCRRTAAKEIDPEKAEV